MRANKLYYTIFAVLMFSLGSCELFQQQEEPVPPTSLEVQINTFTVNSSGDTINVRVECNTEFDYEIDKSAKGWIREVASTNADVLRFKIEENKGYDGREATIRLFTLDGEKEQTVTVRQMQHNALIVAENSYEVGYKGEQLCFELNTNVKYDIEFSEAWLTLGDTRALESYDIVVDVAANNSTSPREAEIVITGGKLTHRISVAQAASPDIIHLTIEHNELTLYSPLWYGDDVQGSVVWNDGLAAEPWNEGASYEYDSLTNDTRKATFSMENATSFTIEQIGNIHSITIIANE
ncbi:MAG: BACON domain-containing protein [Alistipes sp.]|nr:BACON domain-containing protein [Alistipes sp.]